MENQSLIPKLSISNVFYAFASFALLIFGLIYFEGLVKPLVIGFLIWFLIKQIKDKIGKIKIAGRGIPSWLSSLLAFILIGGVIYAIVEILIQNIEMISASMPEYLSRFDYSFEEVKGFISNPTLRENAQKWVDSLNFGKLAASTLNSVSGIFSDFAVILVYVIFFGLEETAGKIRVEKLFPEKGNSYKRFIETSGNINQAVRSYLVSKTLISLITGVVSYLILILLKIEYAFLWSFLIFILNYIPYIGPFISSTIPAIFGVIITGNLFYFLYVFAALEGVQIIIGNFIEPKVMGRSSNLGAVTVILSLAFWGMMWGIVGMFLAIPVTSVFVILLSQIPSTRFIAILLSEKGEIISLNKDTD